MSAQDYEGWLGGLQDPEEPARDRTCCEHCGGPLENPIDDACAKCVPVALWGEDGFIGWFTTEAAANRHMNTMMRRAA